MTAHGFIKLGLSSSDSIYFFLLDYSKWLKKSVPAGSSESSLPGKRVEFPDIPLSAFRRVTVKDEVTPASATSGSSNEKWLKNRLDKWLAVPTTTTAANQFEIMDVEEEEEEEDENLTNQWLLVERTILNNDPVRCGSGSSTSIESWYQFHQPLFYRLILKERPFYGKDQQFFQL